jgi:hypothetical protein
MWAMMALSVAQSQSFKLGGIERLSCSHADVSRLAAAAAAKVDTMHAEWQGVDARFKSMAHMTEVVKAAAVEAARTEAIALVEATTQVRERERERERGGGRECVRREGRKK